MEAIEAHGQRKASHPILPCLIAVDVPLEYMPMDEQILLQDAHAFQIVQVSKTFFIVVTALIRDRSFGISIQLVCLTSSLLSDGLRC